MKPYRLALAAAAALSLGAAGYAVHAQSTAAAPAPAATAASALKAGNYVLDKGHGKITWAINHMGFSTYVGQFINVDATLTVDADPTKSSVTATIPITGVATNDDALNKHLLSPDFFDVAKHSTATFKSTKVEVTGADTGKITGDLTLHGVTKPVVLDVKFNKGGAGMDGAYRLGFDATTTINRTEFGITKYSPMLGDLVTLNLEAEFKAAK